MHALIFAAGRGERMAPLTTHTPKPLLVAGGKRLIEWQIEALTRAGVRDIVINTAHLAAQFEPALGDGARWSVRLHYSHEGDEPLETGGGLLHALPLLRDECFIAVNGDVWCDLDLTRLPREPRGLAHLVLVDNPTHHARGDFTRDARGQLAPLEASSPNAPAHTFSGIGVYRREILDDWRAHIGDAPGVERVPPRFKLGPILFAHARRGLISGEVHPGRWTDVGTPERLAALDAALAKRD